MFVNSMLEKLLEERKVVGRIFHAEHFIVVDVLKRIKRINYRMALFIFQIF